MSGVTWVFTSKKKKILQQPVLMFSLRLAITGMDIMNVNRFEREELAPVYSVFSKTITSYDFQFWKNQDFLKPEDNLLQALKI